MYVPSTPLPSFTAEGLLPTGDYPLTLAELRTSFLVTGEGVESPTAAALNALDPYGAWNWAPDSRTFDHESGKAQLPMWHRYRVELYPHVGQPTGIVDQYGHQLQFPAAFRVRRSTYTPKGIILLQP
jgi:hypothetical protein